MKLVIFDRAKSAQAGCKVREEEDVFAHLVSP